MFFVRRFTHASHPRTPLGCLLPALISCSRWLQLPPLPGLIVAFQGGRLRPVLLPEGVVAPGHPHPVLRRAGNHAHRVSLIGSVIPTCSDGHRRRLRNLRLAPAPGRPFHRRNGSATPTPACSRSSWPWPSVGIRRIHLLRTFHRGMSNLLAQFPLHRNRRVMWQTIIHVVFIRRRSASRMSTARPASPRRHGAPSVALE